MRSSWFCAQLDDAPKNILLAWLARSLRGLGM